MKNLDQIDWEIIALLNKDGRMPHAEIERRLKNVSARTINNRIEALVKAGIINIRAVINPEKVGYGVMAEVFIETEPGEQRAVAEKAAEFPQVSYSSCASGEKDVILSVRARSIAELFDFVSEELGNIPGVRHTQTHLMPLKIKSNAAWIPGEYLDEYE